MAPKFYDPRGIEIPQEYWQALWQSGVPSLRETSLSLSNNNYAILTIWTGIDVEPAPFGQPKIFNTFASRNGEKIHDHAHASADDAMECHYNLMTGLYPKGFRHAEWRRKLYRTANRIYCGVRWPFSVKYARIEVAMWTTIILMGWPTFIPPYNWTTFIFGPLYLLYGWTLFNAIKGLKYAKAQKKIKDKKAADDATFESIMQKEYGDDPGRDRS